jgi:phosphoribosylformimino-5-aminoimidazole carboxamide ribotide isomerase
MDLYARVNILEGRSVRLTHGDLREIIALDADPVGRCLSWERLGVDYLHVVDLDAAIRKDYRNRPLIDEILRSTTTPVQVAGGIRSEQEVERLVEGGAWRVVMGTAAIENQNMVWEACRDFPGKVAVAVDVLADGEVVTGGWTGHSGRYLEEVLVEMSSAGAAAFLVGEARRDALTEPPGFATLADALATVEEPVIASGGVRDLADLSTLVRLRVGTRQLAGVVVGREVTAGRFTVAEARQVITGEAPSRAPGRVQGLRALLRVTDFPRATQFYERVLGFKRLTGWERDSGSGLVLEAAGGETLQLLGPPAGTSWPRPIGVELGFFVEDIQAWHDHLVASGVAVTREMKVEAWGDTVFGVDDPDGVRIWFGQVGASAIGR